MIDRATAESLFQRHLSSIDEVASIAAHRRRLEGADAEDFVAWVKMKIMTDDYAVIRNFRGEAELTTYLAMVVARQSYEYLRERLGRWRPSAAAKRLGPLAEELEALVYREGFSLAQAGEKLRTSGATSHTDGELARLLHQLPVHGAKRPVEVGLDSVDALAEGPSRADERVTAAEADAGRARLLAALERALARLGPEDQMIVRMHFRDEYTVAEVSRALDLDQKPLYRRVERLRTQLRRYLQDEEGVGGTEVREALWEQNTQ